VGCVEGAVCVCGCCECRCRRLGRASAVGPTAPRHTSESPVRELRAAGGLLAWSESVHSAGSWGPSPLWLSLSLLSRRALKRRVQVYCSLFQPIVTQTIPARDAVTLALDTE
jgi:hypothetical protein